jgi:hypothetical protein
MNKRRQGSNLSFPALFVLVLAFVIVSAGGISYVMVKNKQITLRRQIDKTQQRMVEHNVAITMHHSDITQRLGVFSLREELKNANSDLRSIPPGHVQILNTASPPDTVAQRE